MLERNFQSRLISELHSIFPGCVVLKNDANYIQGFPDLTIFFEDRWACLEIKKSADEPYRPNQEWWIDTLDEMSYCATIYPENEDVILSELKNHFYAWR